MLEHDIYVNGNGDYVMPLPVGRYKFMTIFNNTNYVVSIYAGRSKGLTERIERFSLYTDKTVPIPANIREITFDWTGTGADKIRVILSETSLGINQTLVSPGGSSSVIIAGDSAGLAKANQLPSTLFAGDFRVALMAESVGLARGSQLPTVLDSDNLKVALKSDGVGLAKAAQLPSALTGSGNLKVAVSEAAQLPSALTGGGNLKVAVSEGLTTLLTHATTPSVQKVAMTNANTEYIIPLPAGTKRFTVGMVENDTPYRMAFAGGIVASPAGLTAAYIQFHEGQSYSVEGLLAASSLRFACSVAGKHIQVISWS